MKRFQKRQHRKPALVLLLVFSTSQLFADQQDQTSALEENAPPVEMATDNPQAELPSVETIKDFEQTNFLSHQLGFMNVEGIDGSAYQYLFRYHLSVWRMVSFGLGFNAGLLNEEFDKTSEVSGDDKTKAIDYFSVALAGRVQAGVAVTQKFSVAPYIDYSSDLLAKKIYRSKSDDEIITVYEDTRPTDGGRSRKQSIGINFYVNYPAISVGLGFENGRLSGDFGDDLNTNSVSFLFRK